MIRVNKWFILILSITVGAQAATDATCRITLPFEVIVSGPQSPLSAVCKITGPQEWVEKAGGVNLGSFTVKGQVLLIDRTTILSRLAASGLNLTKVKLDGADVVQVRRRETVIESKQIAAKAEALLKEQLAGKDVASMSLLRAPLSVILNEPNVVPEMKAVMNHYQTPGSAKINVQVLQNEQLVGESEVVFSVSYYVRQAEAIQDIQPGTVISPDNVRIQRNESATAEDSNWKEPYGLAAKRRIVKGAKLHPDWLQEKELPVTIRKNQYVLVKIDSPGLLISAPGKALDDGRAGDMIRVLRGQKPDEKIIVCTVQADGSVQPQI